MVFIVKIHEIFHNLHDTVRVSAGRVFPVHPDFHFYWLINMFSWTCKYTFEIGPTRTCPLDRLMTDGHRKVPADKNILDSEHVLRSSSKWFWIQVCKISKMRSPWEWWKKIYFAEIGHFSDSIFGMAHVICLSETIWMVYRTYFIVWTKLKFFWFFMLKWKIKKSFVWRHGLSNRIHSKIFMKFGSK